VKTLCRTHPTSTSKSIVLIADQGNGERRPQMTSTLISRTRISRKTRVEASLCLETQPSFHAAL